MTRTMTLGLALLLVATAPSPAADKDSIEGTYLMVQGENDGKAVPAERIQGSLVKITEDTISVVDKDNKDIYVAKYKLDTTKTPWTVMMTTEAGPEGAKGQKARGVVERDGETLRLCYAPEDGGKTPTSFKTTPDGKQLLFVLKAKK